MSIHSSKVYRPINEVDSSTIDLRSIWWNPTPLKKLPSLKILGGVVVAIFMLLAVSFPVGLIAAIGAGVYFYNLKKSNNTAVDATSLNLIQQEINQSINKAKSQIKIDLGISDHDFSDAENNKTLFSVWNSVAASVTKFEQINLASKINVYTAIITPKGVGYHHTIYDVISQNFYPGNAELMLWNRISRVARVGMSSLIIEANSGSRIEIPLQDDRTMNLENEGNDAITSLVNPFVSMAQKHLATS